MKPNRRKETEGILSLLKGRTVTVVFKHGFVNGLLRRFEVLPNTGEAVFKYGVWTSDREAKFGVEQVIKLVPGDTYEIHIK